MKLTPEQLETRLAKLAALNGEDIQKMLLPELFTHLEFVAELVDIPGNPEYHGLLYHPLAIFLGNLIEQYPYARQMILNVAQKPSGKSAFRSWIEAVEEAGLRCEQMHVFNVNGTYLLHPCKDAYPDYKPLWQNYS